MSAPPFSLLLSDLHLNEAQPALTRQFFRFLEQVAPSAQSVYILGDLFEYWLGDDTLDQPFPHSIVHALRALSDRGVAVWLMHGNRDFLLGKAFAAQCGLQLLADPHLINLYGTPTMLMHGDLLCTDDHDYQTFRQQVRNPAWQRGFLSLPLAERIAMAQSARDQSKSAQQKKSADIMDVNPDAVHDMLRQYGYPRLIHGHTHRQALHSLLVDGHDCQRWVLPDWHDTQAGWLRCDRQGCQFSDFSTH